jgi:glucosamine--fructose-6-phosphate aminotransferase (isomerizing)
VHGDEIFGAALQPIARSLSRLQKIIIAASGSSRHAGLAGEIMLEDLAGVAVDVEYASEYCYRSSHGSADPLVITITQSGETADTVAAQRQAKERGSQTLVICNVANSTAAREGDAVLLTQAGRELAVPATKSFTAQLTILYLLAIYLAHARNCITRQVVTGQIDAVKKLAGSIDEALDAWSADTEACAHEFRDTKSFLYLGRSVHYAIAREGALKLKEVSYAHAEGYPTGELKHGPYALVSRESPLVVIATRDHNDSDSVLRYQKSLAIIADVKKRGGKVIALATCGDDELARSADHIFYVPTAPELLLPIAEVIPLQLFAYHIAVLNGCDVDHPRNLEKAVVRE